MANYASLKAAIQAAIKQNGNNEITGALMQQSLLSMITSLGTGYQFAGVATPATNPGTPDQKVYYIAGAGTYPNMGGAVINSGELGLLTYDGGWQNLSIALDSVPRNLISAVIPNRDTKYNPDGSIVFLTLYVKRYNTAGIQTVQVNKTVQPLSGATLFVLGENNQVSAKAAADVLAGDYVLLELNSSHVAIGGALYSDYASKKAASLYPPVVAASSCVYNDDGSIYITSLTVQDEVTGHYAALTFNQTIQPLPSATTFFVLTKEKTIQAKAGGDVLPTDILLISRLRQSSGGNITGGALYVDYVNKKGLSLISEVISHASNVYNPDGSIYISRLYVKREDRGGVANLQINQTFQPLSVACCFVLTESNTIGVKAFGDVLATDYVLIAMNVAHDVIGGALYSDYLAKVRGASGQNFFNGKKMVANGDSLMYGTTVSDRSRVYPALAGAALGMSVVNYAIGGTTLAKRASDYDAVYLDYSAWQAAVAGGTLDTAKKYLVKDNINVPTRPYHIYTYDNGSWVAGGNASYQAGRTPLVDRIAEMDADADVVLVCVGSNDWAYQWTAFGTDASRAKTDFFGALHLTCQYLATTYPGKLVLFLTPPFAWRYQPTGISQATWNMTEWDAKSPSLQKTWWDYVDAMREVLRQYGFPLFDMGAKLGFSQQNRWWCGDTDGKFVHPGEDAQSTIAEQLCAELLSLRHEVS